jgi:hypothetical protein
MSLLVPAFTYLPDQYAAMKLGIHKSWVPKNGLRTVTRSTPLSPAIAYGRIQGTQRIEGFNDSVGDCMPTGIINGVIDFLAVQGAPMSTVPNSLALDIYSDVTGYVNGDPTTDNGTDPDQFFAWWKQNPILGWKLSTVNLIDPKNENEVKNVIEGVGFAGLVLDLTVAQQNQIIWDATPQDPPWGYHYVNADGYDGPYTATSWGLEKLVNQSFFDAGQVVQVYEYILTQ